MLISSETKKIGTISVIVYLLLLLDSGFYFVAKGGAVIYIQLLSAIVLMLICRARIPQGSFMALYSMVALVIFGTLFSGDSIRNLTVSSIELLTGFCIACALTSEESLTLKKALRIVMMSICVCSLIAFLLTSIRFGLANRLPIFKSSNNVNCYFWGLSFSYVPGEYYIARNLGLFWEPGAFQTYVILALIYELFNGGGLLPRVVYTATVLTTLSSTGIVCLLLVWIVYGFTTGNKRESVLLLAILGCVLSLLYLRLDFLPDSIRFNLIDKVQSVFNGNSKEYVTVTTRMNSIKYGIDLLLEKPFCGIGRGLEGLKIMAGNSIVSCTPINWMLQYGIAFGGIAFVGLYKFLRKICYSIPARLGLFAIILISVSTEAFNLSPTVFFLVFVGFA